MAEILDKYEKSFQTGDVIFCEYEIGDEFYIIKEGKVRITKIQDNKEKTLDLFEPPAIFGEMAITKTLPAARRPSPRRRETCRPQETKFYEL
jgi:CRP-like cAMP-binding protein